MRVQYEFASTSELFAFTPALTPAPLITIAFAAADDGIANQIARKLIRDSVVEFTFKRSWTRDVDVNDEFGAEYIRSAFLNANRRLYEYGHRMLHGGQFGTPALIALLDDNRLTVGRVGQFDCYLLRGPSVIRLFQRTSPPGASQKAVLAQSLGVSPEVELDIASMTIRRGDIFVLLNVAASETHQQLIPAIFQGYSSLLEATREIAREAGFLAAGKDAGNGTRVAIGTIRIGERVIELSEVIEE